jgi:hypothetical protein
MLKKHILKTDIFRKIEGIKGFSGLFSYVGMGMTVVCYLIPHLGFVLGWFFGLG